MWKCWRSRIERGSRTRTNGWIDLGGFHILCLALDERARKQAEGILPENLQPHLSVTCRPPSHDVQVGRCPSFALSKDLLLTNQCAD